jgi:hypothetical protein
VPNAPTAGWAVSANLFEFSSWRAEALFNADPRRFSPETRANSEQFLVVVAAILPELSKRDCLRLAAVIRCLLSAQAWLRMREEFGVAGAESGPMVAWVLDAIVNEIHRGNPPASNTRDGQAAHRRRVRATQLLSRSNPLAEPTSE